MPLDQQQDTDRPRTGRGEMTFFEHISELRRHIVRSFLVIMAIATIFFFNKEFVFHTLIFGPKNPDFWTYTAMCDFSHFLGLGEDMCFTPPKFEIITRELGEVFMEQMYVSFWLGVICAFPFIFWEFWRFISPGLHEHEQKAVRGVVIVCSLLFILGVLFGYYVIAPFSISFLGGYTVTGLVISPTLDSYVTYMTMFTLPTGLVFEMPIVAYFVAKIGLIGASFLRTYRRHAIVIILIVAAIITPPDVVSQTIVTIPLLALYEVSIMVVARVQKQRDLEMRAREAEYSEVIPSDDDNNDE